MGGGRHDDAIASLGLHSVKLGLGLGHDGFGKVRDEPVAEDHNVLDRNALHSIEDVRAMPPIVRPKRTTTKMTAFTTSLASCRLGNKACLECCECEREVR